MAEDDRRNRDLLIQQAIQAGADPAEAMGAAAGISRITVPDTITNQSGVSEDIDSAVYFTEMNG